jgi:tetratricopeptide (TPR) repeat protein
MSEMLDQSENYEEALTHLVNAKQILEENYGQDDKRTCKVKRNIALLYLKGGKYGEALNELREVEELEIRLYGDRSLNLAKTYKVMGTLFTALN